MHCCPHRRDQALLVSNQAMTGHFGSWGNSQNDVGQVMLVKKIDIS